MSEWVYLEHPDTGGACRVPNAPGVVRAHEARGWVVSAEQPDPDATDAQVDAARAELEKPAKKATAAKKAAAKDDAAESADDKKE